jgi:predicted nucleic acid-binding protein
LIVSVDTNVWIAFLRQQAVALPLTQLVLGNLGRRHASVLADLVRLGAPAPRAHDETMAFISRHELQRSGIGYVDAHLLASADAERHGLWTLDADLARAAKRLGSAFVPPR